MTLLADVDAVGSQLLATVGAAVVLGVVTLVWRIWRAVSKMIAHVLPHFVPPTATELRDGVEDNTLPARVKRLAENQEATDGALVLHLANEEKAGLELYDRLDQGDARMGSIEGKLDEGDEARARIESKLDETLDKMAAGNPEIRP